MYIFIGGIGAIIVLTLYAFIYAIIGVGYLLFGVAFVLVFLAMGTAALLSALLCGTCKWLGNRTWKSFTAGMATGWSSVIKPRR